MCFKVIFQILVSLFCVFGIYSLFVFIRASWHVDDSVCTCLIVRNEEAVKMLSEQLGEAKNAASVVGHTICVLVDRTLVSEELMRKIKWLSLYLLISN